MRTWCCESQRIYVGDVGIFSVCALCMDLIIDADIMKTYSVYMCCVSVAINDLEDQSQPYVPTECQQRRARSALCAMFHR